MIRNVNQEPNEMQMSIFTFTHDYYMLQLPPLQQRRFYAQFPFYSEKKNYKGEHLKAVPIVRIYGTNQCNQKCCCHVHGYFPFLYIKLQEFQQAIKRPEFLVQFLLKVQSIYQQAFKTNKSIIYKAQVQYKFDFYGYHSHRQAFLKIYLFDPAYVTKMRQLLSSKIIGNKNFQCYEAHINYYMQFFSDFNIYGINELKICGFTFRKNLKIMKLFEKISSNLTQGVVHRGWNLQELYQKKPQCFNCLYKMSCCYIQVDFTYHSILNAYQLKQSEEQEEIVSSDEDMLSRVEGIRKLKVNVTKALQQIWRDQKKRRNRFKIRKTLEGTIDLSKNIQTTAEVQGCIKDPMWINFLKKGQNGAQLIEVIKSYRLAQQLKQANQLKIDLEGSCVYQQRLAREKNELVANVRGRFDFYEDRKKKIINQIISGDRDELPEWSDDEKFAESENGSENSEDSLKSEDSNLPRLDKKDNNQTIGNTLKYRNNFKFQQADFKNGSLFNSCRFCRQKNYLCSCLICQKCGQEECVCIVQQLKEQKLTNNENFCLIELQFSIPSPSLQEVMINRIVQYQKPFYSNIQDLYQHYKIGPTIPSTNITSQYLEKQLKNTLFFNRQPPTIKNQNKLPYFYQIYKPKIQKQPIYCTYQLQYSVSPPSVEQVTRQFRKNNQKAANRGTSTNKYEDTFVSDLTVMTYELLIEIQENNLYYGNPQKHPIFGLVFEIYNQKSSYQSIRGVIITQKYHKKIKDDFLFDQIFVVKAEQGILSLLISIVFRIDIDIFMSWDMQRKGIRYLLQRGIMHHINMSKCLSRVNDLQDIFQHINFVDFVAAKETHLKREYLIHGNIIEMASIRPCRDNTYYLDILNEKLKKRLQKKPILRQNYFFDIQIKGRINMNLSRLCQQLKLKSYTLQSVVQHIYKTQLSQFTDKYLCQSSKEHPESALQYLLKRIEYQKLITHEVNFIGSIVQKSKVYGADFLSMMERGSQFKIQSIMCRTTKQNDYLTLSATKNQVAHQSLLQCRPLVIQPPKQFYTEPVLLFDFQSLYPSVMIAYNLCYSTCLGSIKSIFKDGKRKKFGVSENMSMHMQKICQLIQNQERQQDVINNLSNNIFVTPNKVAFVKKNMKQGFIPKILLQFLITRIMIKNSTKLYHKQSIKSLLKERQNALKLFMNVMFGYTGASFSGRMPCSEIADSVVQISKYCLRKSIDYLNNHPFYKGKVLYGDTDSIFFHLPNYHIKQTFEIGKILSNQITKMFPYPMEMKFQKVYQSLFLVSKKRYYGKSFQTKDSEPKYEGKGLETVRRDGIPFTSDVMNRILNQLIDTKDLSIIKNILLDQSKRLLEGQVNLSQLCLAKQVKLLKYTPKHCPAHGQAAKRLENIDPMLIPRYGQRLKYVVVQGNSPIRNRAIPLFEYMLKKDKYHLDLNYYYSKLFLPPLRRTLISLFNVDEWGLINQHSRQIKEQSQQTLSHQHTKHQIACQKCIAKEFAAIESDNEAYQKICRQCVGEIGLKYQNCIQWNCKNLFKRRKAYEEWNIAKQRVEEINLIKKILGFK